MANEISESIYLKCSKGYDETEFKPASIQQTWTGTDKIDQTYQLATAYESLGKGEIGDLGICIIRNLTAAGGANVVVSFDGGSTDHLTLAPGEWARFRFVTAYTIANCQIKASATTATARVIILEN